MSSNSISLSVIIPFYTEIDEISEAVSSVVNQTWHCANDDYEICIGNDGPYPNEQILLHILPGHRKKVKISKNYGAKGPGGARNTAMNLAIGKFIAFLDADDKWLPNKLECQMPCLINGATFTATSYQIDRFGKKILPPVKIDRPLQVFYKLGIGTSTVVLHRVLIEELRFRDLRFSQDIDFWYRVAQLSAFVYERSEKVLTVYSSGGSTRNKLVQALSLWKVLTINNIGLLVRILVMLRYASRGVYNHYIQKRLNRHG